ncbi:hypothetical protein VDGL01_05908 [Verticillium dahliae]
MSPHATRTPYLARFCRLACSLDHAMSHCSLLDGGSASSTLARGMAEQGGDFGHLASNTAAMPSGDRRTSENISRLPASAVRHGRRRARIAQCTSLDLPELASPSVKVEMHML